MDMSQAIQALRDRARRMTSLDTPQDADLGDVALDIGAGFIPGVGSALGARDAVRGYREGDYLGMALGAAGMIPVVGGASRAVSKALRAPRDEALETARKNAVKMLGLPENNTAMDRARAMGFDTPAVHFSRHGVDVRELDSGKFAVAPFDAVGTHVGSADAALDRFRNTVGTTDQIKGVTYPVMIKRGKEFKSGDAPWNEDALSAELRKRGGHNWSDMHGGKMTYQQMNEDLRKKLFSEFDSIPYINDVEAKGQISRIVPPQNIRSRFAAFDPAKINESDLLGRADPRLLAVIAGGGLTGLTVNALRNKRNEEKEKSKEKEPQ